MGSWEREGGGRLKRKVVGMDVERRPPSWEKKGGGVY